MAEEKTERRILVSWKEIAAYLRCSVATAQRRAREGMPVFRVGGGVRAVTSELDVWVEAHKQTVAPPARPVTPTQPLIVGGDAIPSNLIASDTDSAIGRYAIIPLGADLAEFRRVELLLRSTEEKYRRLLETLPVWVWELNEEGTFSYSNPAIKTILGYDPSELAGFAPGEFLLAPEDAKEFDAALSTLKNKRKVLRGVRNCFLHRDGTTRWIETDAEPAFEGGCFVGVRGVSHDVTLRVQLEAQVAESRQYLESVLLGSREAIITLDLDGKIKLWNRGAFEVFGYDAAEATGKTLASLVGLASGTGSVTDLIRTVIDNDGWLTSEASVVKDKRGDMKLVTTSYSVIKDARGNVKGLSVICRDIGERLRYEKAILRAAAEWRDTFDAVPDLIMIIDGDYNILRLNRAVADASGHHPAEIVGKKCYRVIHGSDHPLPDCPHRLFMETGVKTTAVIHDPRRARYYEVTCSRIPGLLGDKTSVHVMRDVTERIASEEELKRSRETYRTLVEMVPGGVFTCDAHGRITFASDNAIATIGRRTPAEVLGKYPWDFVLPEQRDRVRAEFAELIKAGRTDGRGYVVPRPDGSRVTLAVTSTLQPGPAGQSRGAVFALFDETARVAAETAIRLERDLAFSLNQTASLEETWRVCLETLTSLVPDAATAIIAFDKTDAGLRVAAASEERDYLAYFDQAVATGALSFDAQKEEVSVLTPTAQVEVDAGAQRDPPATVSLAPVYSDDDVAYYVVVVTPSASYHLPALREWLQITAAVTRGAIKRIVAYEATQNADIKSRTIIESANDAVFLLSLDGTFVHANSAAAAAVGASPNGLCGRNVSDIFPPSTAARHRQAIRALSAGEIASSASRDLINTPAGPRWFDTKVVPVTDRSGKVGYVLGIARDVTEYLAALETVRENEERYRTIFETAADALFLIDAETLTVVDANAAAEKVYGYSRPELLSASFADLVVEQAFARQHLSEAVENLTYPQSRRYHFRKDRSIFPTEIFANVLRLGGKDVILAAVRDVTDRDRYEEELRAARDDLRRRVREATKELREANERLCAEIDARRDAERQAQEAQRNIETILSLTKTGVDVIDSQYNIRFINDDWKRVYGDVGDRKCYQYFMDRDAPCEDCAAARAFETQAPVVETVTLPKEGNRPITVISIPFRNAAGEWLVAEINISYP